MDYTIRPDLYDLQHSGDFLPGERDFYLDLARQAGGPVLELAFGTGRVGLHLARHGIEVVGLDLSASMLERARELLQAEPAEVRDRVTLVEGSMVDFDLGRRFGLVYVPFRAFLHLKTQAQQRSCLRRVAAHLAPAGRFAGNFFQPNPLLLPAYTATRLDGVATTPDGGRIVVSHWCPESDLHEQYKYVTMKSELYDSQGRLLESTLRDLELAWIFGREWNLLLEVEGFQLERLDGGFQGQSVQEGGEYVWVARRAG